MVPMLLRHAAVLHRAARAGLLVALLLYGGALTASARVTGQADGTAAAPPARRDTATPTPMPPDPPAEVVEYYHTDALGSVRLVTDESGQVLRHHDFLPFGEEYYAAGWVPENPPAERKLFTGQERDVELGLDYFGARYYRADVARFTTVDPVYTWSENLTDPQRWNRYAHVRNNPLRYVDPDGQFPVSLAHWVSTYGPLDAKVRDWISAKVASVPAVGDILAPAVDAVLSTYLPVTAGEFTANAEMSAFALAIPLEIPSGSLAKLGSVGGPGAGKTFAGGVKDVARAESPNCVFCGAPTTREPGPLQSNIDHAIPKAHGGNNTLANAQNTCRTCNLKKGVQSTIELLGRFFGIEPQ